jgi:hypothetical protein
MQDFECQIQTTDYNQNWGNLKICLLHYLHYHSHTQLMQTLEKFYS